MSKEVCIIYNKEGLKWTHYLQGQLSNPKAVNARVFLQKDTALFSGTTDARSETRILNASVVVVLVTPGHVDFMISNKTATYDRICPNGDKGLLFFVGLTEDEITERLIEHGKRIFPCFDYWPKVIYDGKESIRELLKRTVDIMERPDPIQSKFTLCPSIVHCEEEATVVALTDKPVPENVEVRAVIRGAYTDHDLPCERVNPHAYSFVVPSHVEDKATVSIFVNRVALRSQAEICFKSYISCSDQTGINEIYCYLLDRLCSFIQNEVKTSDVSEAIDQKLSDVFDFIVDIPNAGFKMLFGVYKYLTKEVGRTTVPTLAHLAAKYNLKDMVGCMQDLHDFSKALYLKNKEMKKPAEIAKMSGFKELAAFFSDIEEQEEMYCNMVYGDYKYWKKYQNMHRRSDSGDGSDYEYPDSDGHTGICKPQNDRYYIDMTQKTRQAEKDLPVSPDASHVSSQQTSDEIDLIMIQKQYKEGKLTMDEVEAEFQKWKKKHFSHEEKSFKSKQVVLKTINQKLSELRSKTKKQKKCKSSKSLQSQRRHTEQDQKPSVPAESPSGRTAEPHSTLKPHKDDLPVLPPRKAKSTNSSYKQEKSVSSPNRFQMTTQETRQRYSDRSSNASSISRTSSASSFSGRGSCTSGIEEDYDQDDYDLRQRKRKSIHMLLITDPPEIPSSSATQDDEYVLPDCEETNTNKDNNEFLKKIGAVNIFPMSPTKPKPAPK